MYWCNVLSLFNKVIPNRRSQVCALLTLVKKNPCFYGYKSFRKRFGKRRNCSSREISPFPKVFSSILENVLAFSLILELSSVESLILRRVLCKPKLICSWGYRYVYPISD